MTQTDQPHYRDPDPLISVVLPLYNEAAVLQSLADRLRETLTLRGNRYEILFVNDGSTDESGDVADRIAADDPCVSVLHLARNFGHQAAIKAGLDAAGGDVVIVMDSDLQDDPSAIGLFLDRWQEGYDVVYARRVNRKENIVKRGLFYSFYRLLNRIAETPMPADAGNFGLLDRCVADCLVQLPERDRYFPGLRNWVGFRQIGVDVERLARHDRHARVSLRGLFRLARSAVFSFSTFPLMVFYGISAISALVCISGISFTLYHKLVTEEAIPGWTSMIITASFFGALNALGISVLGEYVIRIHEQVRNRPTYIVSHRTGAARDRKEG